MRGEYPFGSERRAGRKPDVTKLGYTLSSEEFDAPSLVAQAERAERDRESRGPGRGRGDRRHPDADARGGRGDRAALYRRRRFSRRQENRDSRESPGNEKRGDRDDVDLPRRGLRRARRVRVPDAGRGRRGRPLGRAGQAQREGWGERDLEAGRVGPADPRTSLRGRERRLAEVGRGERPLRGVLAPRARIRRRRRPEVIAARWHSELG